MRFRLMWVLAAAFVAAVWIPVTAHAQSVGVGTIQGRLLDETGATLPGVTVTITSPALQLPQLTEVSDAEGQYRFVQVPIGTYRLQFDLAGFQGVVREGMRLTSGFVARIDVTLKVGSVSETLTVSGQSPVVDTSTTAGITTVMRETLETVPTSRGFGDVLAMAPGFRPAGIDIGGSALSAQRSGVTSYGTTGQITPLLEGINTRQSDTAAGQFLDYSSLEEAEIKAVGNEAEVALSGGAWNAIVKSGGNDFHGRYVAAGQTSKLQSQNVDDDLRAQGVTIGSSVRFFKEFSGDLGGRIVRDRLWFYGALHDQKNEYNLIGFARAPGPDNVYQTADDVAAYDVTEVWNQTLKGTYQATKKYKLVGFIQRNAKIQPNGQASGLYEPYPASTNYRFPTRAAKGELTGTVSPRALFTAMFGRQWYDADRFPQDGEDRKGNPRTIDRETMLNLGPPGTNRRPRARLQSSGSLSIFPKAFLGGNHMFKMGYQSYLENVGTSYPNMQSGNYQLVFDRVNGLPHQASEINAYNNPVSAPASKDNMNAMFLQDKWVAGRVTLSMGLRWERYHAYVGEQVKEQGVFGNSGTFPYRDVLTWKGFAPRLGSAWDVFGDGKNVVKATYGKFNYFLDENFSGGYNLNGRVTYRYRWQDVNRNGDYDPGEVNLDLSGPDFISVSGATNNLLNPDLEQPVTHELSLGFERELMENFSARVLYVFKRVNNLYASINVLRPSSAYNIPLTRRDPGPDGVLNTRDDGGSVTIYDYDAAFRGSTFVGNQFQNAPDDRDDHFQTIEFSATKRLTNKWSLGVTTSLTQNHHWSTPILDNPNQDHFPLDSTRDWYFKLNGSYQLPWGLYTSAYYQGLSGQALQRTYVFRAADPDGGIPLRQLSTVTLALEPYGARRLPAVNIMNYRVSKKIALPRKQTIEFDVDLFNALNVNTVQSMTVASGPTFGAISNIVPPRIARFSAIFNF